MTNTLEERLLRLERQNRWMKRVGGCVLVLLVVTIAAGANSVRTATGYTLTDSRGKVRGYFGLSTDNRPMLQMKDQGGKIRVELGMDSEKMPYLNLTDPRETTRASVRLESGEGGIWPTINIHGRRGEVVAKLGASSNKRDSHGSFYFYDSNGTTRVAFGVGDNPYLVLNDKNGNPMQTLFE